jgi:hypothetical protein
MAVPQDRYVLIVTVDVETACDVISSLSPTATAESGPDNGIFVIRPHQLGMWVMLVWAVVW